MKKHLWSVANIFAWLGIASYVSLVTVVLSEGCINA